MDSIKRCFLLGLILSILSVGLCVPPPEFDIIDRDLRVPPETNHTTPTSIVTQRPTHPPMVLRQRYVTKDGRLWTDKPQNESSVNITATSLVKENSIIKAGLTIAGMTRDMPQAIFEHIAGSHGVRIFPTGHGMTIYPEMAMHANTHQCQRICSGNCRVTCSGSRKIDYLAGQTGRYSYVLEASIHCKVVGYYRLLNVLGHEFSHLLMNYLPAFWRNKIFAAYNTAKSKGTWPVHTYAMSNHNEYWAEASGAFFSFDHMPFGTTGGMNKFKNVNAARSFLKEKDPQVYAVLDYVYTNNHPEINQHVNPCM